MNNSAWLSFCIGIWGAINNTIINKPKLDIWHLDWQAGSIELGGTFWLKVAAFLFVLRVLHKIISTGTILFADITNFWKNIKTFFTGNIKEDFSTEYTNFLLESKKPKKLKCPYCASFNTFKFTNKKPKVSCKSCKKTFMTNELGIVYAKK